jgi:hypothetical protein
MSAIEFNGELTFIGPACSARSRALPLLEAWARDQAFADAVAAEHNARRETWR